MKKITLLVATLATVAAVRAAEEPKSAYSVTTDFTYASSYVFRGVEQANNSFQPSVEVAVGDFNVGLWTNQPITKKENNEIDLYAGYAYHVNSALKLEVVGTYYYYPEAKESLAQTKQSYEAGVGATYTINGFSPSLYYYHDFRLHSDTVQAALGYSLPLGSSGLSLDTSIFIGAVDAGDLAPDSDFGGKVKDTYTYHGADVSVPYKLSANATFTVGAHYSNTVNLAQAGGPFGTVSRDNLWFTAGISVGF